jgi:hypothetical protein
VWNPKGYFENHLLPFLLCQPYSTRPIERRGQEVANVERCVGRLMHHQVLDGKPTIDFECKITCDAATKNRMEKKTMQTPHVIIPLNSTAKVHSIKNVYMYGVGMMKDDFSMKNTILLQVNDIWSDIAKNGCTTTAPLPHPHKPDTMVLVEGIKVNVKLDGTADMATHRKGHFKERPPSKSGICYKCHRCHMTKDTQKAVVQDFKVTDELNTLQKIARWNGATIASLKLINQDNLWQRLKGWVINSKDKTIMPKGSVIESLQPTIDLTKYSGDEILPIGKQMLVFVMWPMVDDYTTKMIDALTIENSGPCMSHGFVRHFENLLYLMMTTMTLKLEQFNKILADSGIKWEGKYKVSHDIDKATELRDCINVHDMTFAEIEEVASGSGRDVDYPKIGNFDLMKAFFREDKDTGKQCYLNVLEKVDARADTLKVWKSFDELRTVSMVLYPTKEQEEAFLPLCNIHYLYLRFRYTVEDFGRYAHTIQAHLRGYVLAGRHPGIRRQEAMELLHSLGHKFTDRSS